MWDGLVWGRASRPSKPSECSAASTPLIILGWLSRQSIPRFFKFHAVRESVGQQSTMTCAANGSRVPPNELARAAALLRAGRLVAFPTETVYGLGANALDPEAVARIYAVKRRPATSPLIVHVASVDMAKSLVADWPETAALLTKNFWPGPLTLVLPVAHVEKHVEKKDSVDTGVRGELEVRVGTGVPPVQAEQSSAALSSRTIPPHSHRRTANRRPPHAQRIP